MLRYIPRLLFLLLLSLCSFGLVSAQRLRTFETPSGYAFDYPFSWNVAIAEDSENVALFDDGSMFGFISLVDLRFIDDDPVTVLEDVLSDRRRSDRNDGDVEEIEDYVLLDEWEAARTSRIRESDSAYEVFIMASVRRTSVYVRAAFRRGAEDEYIPQLEAMIGSVRDADDENFVSESEDPRISFNVDFIGVGDESLNIGALTASYNLEDFGYQLDYPQAWEINEESESSLRFLNRSGTTIIGTLSLENVEDVDATTSLANFLEGQEGYSEIQGFSLNGLEAARAYRLDTRGGTSELAMAADFGDVLAILQASSNTEGFAEVEAVLRAVLYSVRPIGSDLQLSLVGNAAREALNTAFIYGDTIVAPRSTSGIPLEQIFITEDERYTFNFPEDWFQTEEDGTLLLVNNEDYEAYIVEEGKVQVYVNFLDRIRGLDIDDLSPRGILEFIIENDEDAASWSDIEAFDSLGRRAAYADYNPRFTDLNGRSIFVELDETDSIYVRFDMLSHEDEIDNFFPTVLAILETVDFAD